MSEFTMPRAHMEGELEVKHVKKKDIIHFAIFFWQSYGNLHVHTNNEELQRALA
jgi:hypothetical protein